jgi:uncharacterized protein YdaU (DUF1376 family)
VKQTNEVRSKMHYYQFNIGDYQSHTGHLSELEDLAYRRLLDWVYLHEKPIPLEINEVARNIRMRTHCESIAIVLQEFFVRTEAGWVSDRVQREIAKSGDKSQKASQSAKARWDADALRTQSESNATHNTGPITQDTLIPVAKATLSTAKLMACPQEEILKLWAKHLPHLAQPRSWEGTRRANTKQRWNQASKPSQYSPDGYETEAAGIKWWDSFFGYIARDTTLSNGFESQGRTWRPDLEWVVNATNFQKIIDGKYSK